MQQARINYSTETFIWATFHANEEHSLPVIIVDPSSETGVPPKGPFIAGKQVLQQKRNKLLSVSGKVLVHTSKLLADLGKAKGCYINTVAINYVTILIILLEGAAKPKRFEMAHSVIK